MKSQTLKSEWRAAKLKTVKPELHNVMVRIEKKKWLAFASCFDKRWSANSMSVHAIESYMTTFSGLIKK